MGKQARAFPRDGRVPPAHDEHPWPQDTVHPVPGGQVRILIREQDDYSDVYVLDVLGLSILVRERQRDTFVHAAADGTVPLNKRPVAVAVFGGGENEYGEADEYCASDACGQQLTRDGQCLDSDGYNGLCGNCADREDGKGGMPEDQNQRPGEEL